MALIRRVNELVRAAAASASPEAAALARAEGLMPAYAAATRRHNAALKRALAVRAVDGGSARH